MQYIFVLTRSRLGANAFFLCACLLLTPGTAAAQSLLETWVFAHHHGLIPIDQLKETSDGTLVTPDHPKIMKEGSEVWSVIDKRNCVIRVEYSASKPTTDYYLNNISVTRPTIFKAAGGYQIGLMGEKPVHCRHSQSGELCEHFTTLDATDRNGYRAIKYALNHIYGRLCSGDKP